MRTIGGGQAAGIARWAWQDPASRVLQAIGQVNELAARAADPVELAEIQDSGTMLSRLAGSLEPDPGPQTLTAQLGLTADSLAGQVLELGRSQAWRHEHRGPHGEWVSGGGGGGAGPRLMGEHEGSRVRQERMRRMARDRQERLIRAEIAQQARSPAATAVAAPVQPGNKAADIASQARAQLAEYDPKTGFDPKVPTVAPPDWHAESGAQWEKTHEQFFQQRIVPHVEAKAQAALAQAQQHTQKAIDALNAEGEAHEKHSAALKAATEGSIAIAGGMLAYIEAKMGVSDLVAIASATGPILIQIIIEFFKRL